MAGIKKSPKPSFEKMTPGEQNAYNAEQLVKAKRKLQQCHAAGDTKGEKRMQEIVNNIEFSMRLMEQRSTKNK